MEGLGAEVSAKIRSAIKAKLIELEAYVDDELPDYIMVMVANKRTKEQMEDDLGLFLNNNTGAFTHWLHAVLEKLQKVTLGEVAKSKKEVRKKKKPTKESSSSKRPKDGKDSQKRERERKPSSSVSRREEGSRSSRSSKKPREEPKPEPKAAVIPKGIPREVKGSKGTANPNIEALGKRQPKKTASPAGGGLGSGAQDGYDPSSLLKNAIAKTKTVSRPKLVVKKPSSPASKKISSPSLKKLSSSSKKSPTKKLSSKKDSSRKSKSSKKSAADIFKEDGDVADVQLNLSHEDKSDPMFANLEDKVDSESGDKKKIINLKEESEFHGAKSDDKQNLDFEIKKRGEREKAEKAKAKKVKDESRSRSRKEESRSRSRIRRESSPDGRKQRGKGRKRDSHSRSGSRGRSGLASMVVKPVRHDADNEYDAEKMLKRSLVSKAQIPPRPVRPTGREEKGSARAIGRAMAAADRSIMTSKRRADSPPPRGMRSHMDSPPRGRRDRSPIGRRSESPSRRFGARGRDWDARPESGKRGDERDDRRERVPRLSPDDIEKYKAMKEKYALKRQAASGLETRRLNDVGKRGRREFPERRLAMDDEMEKRGRRSSLDRKLEGRRRPIEKEDDDIRIIVRRDISPESPPKRRREEGKRQEDVSRRQREQEKRLDEDDDELLEMRKKALESLMRRRSREDVDPGERKIIIPLDDESSSDSDTSSSSKDSEVSLSDVEELQAKSRELERRARNRQGQGRSQESRKDKKREVREEEGSDNEREPTFTVTLDGIDEKYFKKSGAGPLNAPLPLIRQSPEKTEDDLQNDREEESDQELVLHPTEDFDEPETVKEVNSSKKKVPQEEKKDLKEKDIKEKDKFLPKPLKPTLSSTDAKSSKPIAPVTGRKRSPIRGPTEKIKTAPVKKVAAVKPSVAAVKPSVAAVIKPIPATKPASSEQKQKIKRTPITAPEPDSESIKPNFSRTISNTNYTRAISAPVYNTAPVALQKKSGATCMFWPQCTRGDSCIFYHPPVATSAEVILSNKYKWTAT